MSYAAAWRPDGLYFFLHVEDPDRCPAESSDYAYQGDAVEVYVDADGFFPDLGEWDDRGARSFGVAAPADDTTPSSRAGIYMLFAEVGPLNTDRFTAVPTPHGYDAEAFVVAEDLGLGSWSLSADDTVGIDVGHDVSFPPGESGRDGNRAGLYSLRLVTPPTDTVWDYPMYNENAFCTTTLLAP